MAVSLSRTALARAQHASDEILSAATEEAPSVFRLTVSRVFRDLLGGDRGLCFFPVDGMNPFGSEDFSAEWLDDFAAYFLIIDEGARRARAFGLNVWTQAQLVRGETRAYHRSEQFQRWSAPNRLHDAAGVTLYSDVNPGYPDAFVVGYSEQTSPAYGDRALVMLSLVRPAFRAGVHLQWALGQRVSAMQRLLDDLAQGIAVFDEYGHLLHRNPKLTAMLAAEPQSAVVEEAARRAAAAASAQRASRGTLESALSEVGHLSTVVRGDRVRYRVSAVVAEPGVLHHARASVVAVEALSPTPPSYAELRDHFGLTPREVQVAELLARGRTNAEIARDLQVTEHTAERHTEHVFAKLGVHTRAAVGARLREV